MSLQVPYLIQQIVRPGCFFDFFSLQQMSRQMLGLVTVDRAVGEFETLRYAPVRCSGNQGLVDTVPLLVVAHGAPSRHRAKLLPISWTCCSRSYPPRPRLSSIASHSLTLFSYQIGPIASWRLGRGMRRKFLRER